MSPDTVPRQPSQPDPETSLSVGNGGQDAVEDAIPSDALLRGSVSVSIDHAGTRYTLRATRAGKLILTK